MNNEYGELVPLINEAKQKRMLIQHITEPGIVFPDELTRLNQNGQACQPPKFWRLRDPKFILNQLEKQIGMLVVQKIKVQSYMDGK